MDERGLCEGIAVEGVPRAEFSPVVYVHKSRCLNKIMCTEVFDIVCNAIACT